MKWVDANTLIDSIDNQIKRDVPTAEQSAAAVEKMALDYRARYGLDDQLETI